MDASSGRSLLRFFLALLLLGAGSGAAPARDAGDCPPIEGIDGVLGKGRVLLLGEIHGTAEGPAFVEAVACHAVAAGLPVVVALELPRDEQEAVSGFLASEGGEAARGAVRALPFWAKEYQDGRSSRAMLDLLDGLRSRRGNGGHLGVLLFDRPGDFSTRDRAMGERIVEAAKAHPQAFLVSLSGNLHSRTDEGSGRMGATIEKALGPDRVRSLKMSHTGGTAWICEATAGCGPLRLGGRGEGEDWRILMDLEAGGPGHDGTFHVGSISASPPARGAPAGPGGGI